jgi:hypothetical protein
MKIDMRSRSNSSGTTATPVKMGIIAAGLLLILGAPLGVPAQQTTNVPSNNAKTVEELTNRLAELEARIRELEARETAKASPTPTASPSSQESTTDNAEDQPPEVSGTDTPRLQIHGFGELEIGRSYEQGNIDSSAAAELETLISSKLSNRLSMLADIEIASDNSNRFHIGIERLLLKYSPSDYFNLSVGRNFTSIGYYNTAHRGTWLQTATDPPLMFESEDEGGLLPIHSLGVSANGVIPSGSLGLRYVAEIGVGRTLRTRLDQASESVIDENNGTAFTLGMSARPDKVPGLEAGLSIHRDSLAPSGMPKIKQTILAAHLVFRRSALEILTEALVVRHTLQGANRIFNTTGFYSQISQQFGKYSPYFRYEYVNASGQEPIFSDVGRRRGPSFGLRYDLGKFVALTAQYKYTARRLQSPINALTLQLTFAF